MSSPENTENSWQLHIYFLLAKPEEKYKYGTDDSYETVPGINGIDESCHAL